MLLTWDYDEDCIVLIIVDIVIDIDLRNKS